MIFCTRSLNHSRKGVCIEMTRYRLRKWLKGFPVFIWKMIQSIKTINAIGMYVEISMYERP